MSKSNGYATEAIGNIRVVKSFSTERKEINIFDRELFKTFEIGKTKSSFYGVFTGIFTFVGFGIVVVVLYFGGKMVIENEMTIGDLSGFVLYTMTMSIGLLGIGNNMNTTISAAGVAEKIFEIMDKETKITPG